MYNFSSTIKEQGIYQLRIMHAFPGGLKGEYFSDGFFERLALTRIDRTVNFTWATGRLIPRGSGKQELKLGFIELVPS